MIPKKIRFHGYGSLRYLYKNADTYRSKLLIIRPIINPRRKNSRYTVVVSKKVHKSAVGRNRIRRRLYEILRREIPKINQTVDLAIIVTNGETLMASHQDLQSTVVGLLKQTKFYGHQSSPLPNKPNRAKIHSSRPPV